VSVVRLGTEPVVPPPRAGNPVVAGGADAAELLGALERAVPQARVVLLDRRVPPPLEGVDIVLVLPETDRYGLLVPAAIGHGCGVVSAAPFDALSALAPGVSLVAPGELFATLVAKTSAIADVRALATEAYLDARRRLDAYLATQLVSELARSITGGVPASALAEVDAAYARRLCGARYAYQNAV
jgi:hypothetical protein